MKHSSIKLNTPCELINLTPLNPLISKCQIKVCYVGDEPNRNKSIITKDVARELANSLPGSPIVGYFNDKTGDFEEHNRDLVIDGDQIRLEDTTRPYGFVDLGAQVWFQKFLDDGVEHEYMMTEGWLWTGQYPECKRVIEKGNNQSMELDQENVDGYWTRDEKGDPRFFIINEAIMSKLCILGEDYEPCFEGATITAPKFQFSFEESFKEQLFSMINELKEILNEGGASMVTEETIVVEEEVLEPVEETQESAVEEEVPAVETVEEEAPAVEPVEETPEVETPEAESEFACETETCPECGKPVEECECGEDKKDEYVLDEIPEYVELRNNYSELEGQYNSLREQYEELVNTNNELSTFKAGIEKKEKEAMIDSFYMLSDLDKADVVAHIDEYSLDEIEAKLSVICVRNKVSFNLDDDKKGEEPTTYNLNGGDIVEDSIPAWIKSLQSVAKSMN